MDKREPPRRIGSTLPRDPLETFAENLRRLREARGMSQEELGSATGVGMSNVSRYETARRDPGVRTVAKLAAGLGVEPAALLDRVRLGNSTQQH
jgi:transcriptional regulator with XRE-family HTH domain